MTRYEFGPSLILPSIPVTCFSAGRTTATDVLPVMPKTVNATAASNLSSFQDGRCCRVQAQKRCQVLLVAPDVLWRTAGRRSVVRSAVAYMVSGQGGCKQPVPVATETSPVDSSARSVDSKGSTAVASGALFGASVTRILAASQQLATFVPIEPPGRPRTARKAAEGHQYQGKPWLTIEFEYLALPTSTK